MGGGGGGGGSSPPWLPLVSALLGNLKHPMQFYDKKDVN